MRCLRSVAFSQDIAYYTLESYIKKISTEEFEKARASAISAGIEITDSSGGESFTVNKDNYDTYRRITYMQNCHNLSGCYESRIERDL